MRPAIYPTFILKMLAEMLDALTAPLYTLNFLYPFLAFTLFECNFIMIFILIRRQTACRYGHDLQTITL